MDNLDETNHNETDPIILISELNGAVKLQRTILVGNKPKSYEYYYQTESGPCAALTFMNLWSLVHGKLPNLKDIDQGLINNGTSRKVWTDNFSLIYGSNPNNKEFQITLGLQDPESKKEKALSLMDYLDTIRDGSMICGTQQHCNAIHKWDENQYVLVEPNDTQGLKVMTRDESTDYIENRFTNDHNYQDYFYFIGPDINTE